MTPLQAAECKSESMAAVFLHCFGGSGKSWAQVSELLGASWHCVTPDLRGFGDSKSLPEPYTLADAADDVLALVKSLGLDRYTLVGHSMGGKIAMAIAARQPPGLVQLVLLAPSPPSPEPIPTEERAQLLADYLNRAAAENATRKSCGKALPAALFTQAVDDRLCTSHVAWRWWLEIGSKEDISVDLMPIRVPCQVLVGASDINIPASLVQAEVMPHLQAGKLQIVPGVGHLLPLEAPYVVVQAIIDCAFEDRRNPQKLGTLLSII